MQSVEHALTSVLKHVREGAAASESHQYASAADAFARGVVDARGALVGLLAAEAGAALSAGDIDRARRAAQEAISADANAGLAWYWVGAVAHAQSEMEIAKNAFEKAARLETDRTKVAAYLDWAKRCDKNAEFSDIGVANASEDVQSADGGLHTSTDGSHAAGVSNPSASSKPSCAHAHSAASSSAIGGGPAVGALPVAPRMEWYQSNTAVTIDIYAKNVDKDNSVVEISADRIGARLARPGMDDYVFEKHLFSPIDVSNSSWSASRVKVEIKLRKADAGREWKSLSSAGADVSANEKARMHGEQKMKAVAQSQKNWDEIAAKELEGYKEGDDVMNVFKSIYANADEDARRAMMKSYSESGGKVLSTDWSDVKQRKVEYKEDNT